MGSPFLRRRSSLSGSVFPVNKLMVRSTAVGFFRLMTQNLALDMGPVKVQIGPMNKTARPHVIKVRISDKELATWLARAQKQGFSSVAAWLRAQGAKALESRS